MGVIFHLGIQLGRGTESGERNTKQMQPKQQIPPSTFHSPCHAWQQGLKDALHSTTPPLQTQAATITAFAATQRRIKTRQNTSQNPTTPHHSHTTQISAKSYSSQDDPLAIYAQFCNLSTAFIVQWHSITLVN